MFLINLNAEIVTRILSFRKSRHKPNLESTSKYGFSPDLGGGKWRRSEYAHASYPGLFFRPPGFSPYMGREERRVQDWTTGFWVCPFGGNLPKRRSVIQDHSDRGMAHQRNRRVHSGHAFSEAFNGPLSYDLRSLILSQNTQSNANLDHLVAVTQLVTQRLSTLRGERCVMTKGGCVGLMP